MKMKPIARAQQAEHVEDESIGARQQPFLVAERRHHLRARLPQQIAETETNSYPLARSPSMMRGSASTVWLRSPPPSCSRMMLPLSAVRVGDHALNDRVRRRRRRRHSARPNRADRCARR